MVSVWTSLLNALESMQRSIVTLMSLEMLMRGMKQSQLQFWRLRLKNRLKIELLPNSSLSAHTAKKLASSLVFTRLEKTTNRVKHHLAAWYVLLKLTMFLVENSTLKNSLRIEFHSSYANCLNFTMMVLMFAQNPHAWPRLDNCFTKADVWMLGAKVE